MLASHPTARIRAGDVASLAAFLAATGTTGFLGSRSSPSTISLWYEKLEKPSFVPPRKAFPIVWTALYGLAAVAGWRIFRRPPSTGRTASLALWAAQLGLSGLWPWLFFSKRRIGPALADSALLLAVTSAFVLAARRVDPVASKLLLPYVGWVGFATVLNEEILRRNR